MDYEKRAEEDIPKLIRYCEELVKLADKVSREGNEYEETDHFALMAFCFLERQKYHMTSVLKLIESGTYQDAGIIARTMLEGMCILKWAEKDKNFRPLKWRAFAFIEDFRLIKTREREGTPTDAESKAATQQGVGEYGPLFYTAKSEKQIKKGNPKIEDPYSKYWLGEQVTISRIFAEVAPRNYYEAYDNSSKWVHWTVRSLAYAINISETETYFDLTSFSTAADALNVAFAALWDTLKIFISHFGLLCIPALEEMKRSFFREIGSSFNDPRD